MQASNSIMCGYACVGFIDFMFADKTLNDYTSFFSSYDFLKIYNKIFDYSKNEWMQFHWNTSKIFKPE